MLLNSTRSRVASMITLATSPEKSMSFAPTVRSTRSSVRFGRVRRAVARYPCSCVICAGTVLGQFLSGAQLSSRARCEPSTPASIVAPVQASGRKVTATCGFSIASVSAVRI